MMSSFQLPTEYRTRPSEQPEEMVKDIVVEKEQLFTLQEMEKAKSVSFEQGLQKGIVDGQAKSREQSESKLEGEIKKYELLQSKMSALAKEVDAFFSKKDEIDERKLVGVIASVVFKVLEECVESQSLIEALVKQAVADINRESEIVLETAMNTKPEIEVLLDNMGFQQFQVREAANLSVGEMKFQYDNSIQDLNLRSFLDAFVEKLEGRYKS